VITKIEPRLFQKVTGLTTADFERLVSLGVFNSQLMNDAVWKFRRYEDASLRYMGVERHRPLELGLWDTALTEEDFRQTFEGLVAGWEAGPAVGRTPCKRRQDVGTTEAGFGSPTAAGRPPETTPDTSPPHPLTLAPPLLLQPPAPTGN